MLYNVKEPKKSVKSEWRNRAAEFETKETAESIRSFGGLKKNKTGGMWISEDEYISIEGNRKSGMPYKY